MKKLYITFLLIVVSLSNTFSQLSFTVAPSMSDLTNYFQGIGLTISNMTVTGAPNSYGFYSGTSNMAFGSGIIMSTGVVSGLINNPAGAFASTDNMTLGNMYANALSGSTTYDACMIEFDCVPVNANLLFDFSFGSEEYNEFIGSPYNDVFGILVSGPNPAGGNYLNMNCAVIPGTSMPIVSINNINNGSSGAGPCINCAYYIDNSNGTDVAYDGFTAGLQGLVPVIPGQTYHFRLVIADVSDGIYDSAVMFLTNSFKSIPVVTSVIEHKTENDLLIYPVPAKDKIYYSSSTFKINKTELYSIDGKKIHNIKLDLQNSFIDTKDLDAGIYFLHLSNETNTIVKKVIIQ